VLGPAAAYLFSYPAVHLFSHQAAQPFSCVAVLDSGIARKAYGLWWRSMSSWLAWLTMCLNIA